MVGIGSRLALRTARKSGTTQLVAYGTQAADHSTGTSFSPSITSPEGVDAIAVLWVARANGGGNTYAPTLTVGGISATRLGGNSNLATADNAGFTDLFFVRGAFSGEVALALAPGASVRPGRLQVFFLSGSREATTLGASLLVKQTTSGTALTGAITPTVAGSLVLVQRAIFGTGSPTFAAYTPAAHIDHGDSPLSAAATLSRAGAKIFTPASTDAVTIDSAAAAAATQRNLGAWEIVR